MDEIRYYEVDTKQEIKREDIESGKTYIEFRQNEKWKVRLVTFEGNMKVSERLLTPLEEEKAKIEIIRQKFLKRGYSDVKVVKEDTLKIDGIEISVPNYRAIVSDEQGRKSDAFFNRENLESMVQSVSNQKRILINDITVLNGKNAYRAEENHIQSENSRGNNRGNSTVSQMQQRESDIVINYNQWGCKGTISLKSMKDLQSFYNAVNSIPKNRQEAMDRLNNSDEKERK